MSVSLYDYVDAEQGVVITARINDRIEELSHPADGLDLELADEDRAELELLTAFRDELERRSGQPFSSLTIIPEGRLGHFLRAEHVAAGEVSAALADYVDWDQLAAERSGRYAAVEDAGERYLVLGL